LLLLFSRRGLSLLPGHAQIIAKREAARLPGEPIGAFGLPGLAYG
jgi:hypothetical protein